MRELTLEEVEVVSGGDEATAEGYAAACGAGAVTGGMAAAWTGGGIAAGAAGRCLLGMMGYGVDKLLK